MIGQGGLLAFDRLAVPRTILPVRGHYHPLFAQRMPSFFPSHIERQIIDLCSTDSEFDSRAELHGARVEHASGFAKVRIRSIRNDSAWVQVDAIEQVVELGAELEARAFLTVKPGDAETSSEAEVDELQPGSPECVATEIPPSAPPSASPGRITPATWRQREPPRRQEPGEKIGSVGVLGVPERRREGRVRPTAIPVEVLTGDHPERIPVLEAADGAQLPVSKQGVREPASEEIFWDVIYEVE